MESFFPSSVVPLPFQRRLTKMYTDTKSSYDFVKEPVQSQEDPELVALHRKLRIQKDRLVSWGLEWSDPSQSQSPDIDESINKAGLSELVGSVMSTIKEILAEAEPLWQSSKRIGLSSDEKLPLPEKGKQNLMITWDKSRFQDLVRDLTMSIDTLYDLSRTRQSARKAVTTPKTSTESTSKSRAAEERLFESTRMQTPQQIDPKSLTWPRDLKGIQSGMLQPAKSPRQIVFMRRLSPLPDSRKLGQQLPLVPVLLEHAPYDPIYSITGISPSMTRFERLFAALSQSYSSAGRTLSGLLQLIGYFEEAEHSRFCLLFALPTHFGPVDIETPRMPSITILSDLLFSPFEPTLEVRYRLAFNIASAVFDLHAKGVVHGNIIASNVLFIEPQSQNQKGLDLSTVNMRQSFLASYDLFSDNATESSAGSTSLYRHPLDPRVTKYTHLTSESKSLDLYSLAILLLEIGLWTSITDIFPMAAAIPENTAAVMQQLATRCGSLYTKAVQACWHSPDDELSQRARADVMHQKVFWKVSKALDTCCAIDESSDEEAQDSEDSGPIELTPVKASRPAEPVRRTLKEQTSQMLATYPTTTPKSTRLEKQSYVTPITNYPEKLDWSAQASAKVATPISQHKSKPKLRTYPAIRIAQEHLDFWHTGLMPHINHVLRGFYRKYPESVEISLESIGETPSTTKPTILVICTSVHKVRSILKKHLVYDKSVFGLKVCRGKVVRSRKQGVKRSMLNEGGEDVKAQNGEHQLTPSNGASIGAYINEHHLPPVSFGGMIVVDDKAYGMTVHHMLDDPSEGEDDEEPETAPILRSSAHADMPDLTYSDSSVYESGDEEYMYPLSDYESDFSSASALPSEDEFSDYEDDDDIVSNYSSDSRSATAEPGDIPGIPAGCGDSYLITQPALDDVPASFFPSLETRDEDHIDSFQLGEVYASSGIRRRTDFAGVTHEIDWALFEFESHRKPDGNSIPCKDVFDMRQEGGYPRNVVASRDLHDLNVHCMARTSGLQTGRVLPGMVIVKIFGRTTPSSSFQVAGKLGVPGDSGAWIVESDQHDGNGSGGGRLAGHVLAWSGRKKVAYICPMDILIHDIGETLGAEKIALPGGERIYPPLSTEHLTSSSKRADRVQMEEKVAIEEDELATLLRGLNLPPTPEQIDGMPYLDSHSAQIMLDGNGNENQKNVDAGVQREEFFPIRMMPTGGGSGKSSLRTVVNVKSVGTGGGGARGTTQSITVSESDMEIGEL